MSQTSTEPLFPPRGDSSSNLQRSRCVALAYQHRPLSPTPFINCAEYWWITSSPNTSSCEKMFIHFARSPSPFTLQTTDRKERFFNISRQLPLSRLLFIWSYSRSVSIWAARFTGMVQPMLIPIAGLLDRFRISKSLNRCFMSLTIDCQRMTYQWPAGFELVGSKRVQLFFSNRFDTRYYFRLEDVSIIHQPSLENAAYRWSTRYSLTSTWFGQIVSSSMLWLWVRIAVECTCRSFPELERDSLWPCRSTSPSIVLVSFDEKMSAINLGS